MEPAKAREGSWWEGQPLPEQDLQKVLKYIKAFRVKGDRIVVVVSTSNNSPIENVVICNRPPCWPPSGGSQ
jgi:hypothetical protein